MSDKTQQIEASLGDLKATIDRLRDSKSDAEAIAEVKHIAACMRDLPHGIEAILTLAVVAARISGAREVGLALGVAVTPC